MPGHKGRIFLGAESRDITEICGADSLFEADGIIAESEKNASNLFDTKRTVYSCEGSTLSIKAMLYLAAINRENKSERPVFVAARNVHRAFVYASAELDADVVWLTSKDNLSLCSCKISAEDLKETLSKQKVKPAGSIHYKSRLSRQHGGYCRALTNCTFLRCAAFVRQCTRRVSSLFTREMPPYGARSGYLL